MYKVIVVKSAIKELSKLPSKESLRLSEKINELKDDPRPPGCIKLTGRKDKYRIRVGNYRVLYTVEDTILVVHVIKVRNRKDIY